MTDNAIRTTPPRRVLAWMAHPDDAEILCAGTLIRLAEAGWEVHIATATSGDCGTQTQPAGRDRGVPPGRGPTLGRDDRRDISLP